MPTGFQIAERTMMSPRSLFQAYDPSYPTRYRREASRIVRALGPMVARIEHVGSTSVRGLPGKPTIDILVGTAGAEVGPEVLQIMADLGYEYRGEMGVPGRDYFRKGETYPRDYNVHIVALGGKLWNDNRLFRDYLRAHPQVAREYVQLKERLADAIAAHGASVAFGAGKAPFIEKALADARAWDEDGRPKSAAR